MLVVFCEISRSQHLIEQFPFVGLVILSAMPPTVSLLVAYTLKVFSQAVIGEQQLPHEARAEHARVVIRSPGKRFDSTSTNGRLAEIMTNKELIKQGAAAYRFSGRSKDSDLAT